jgi:hypothetical protein
MSNLVFKSIELGIRAKAIEQRGEALRNIGNRLLISITLNPISPLEMQKIWYAKGVANRLISVGNRMVNLGSTLESFVDSTISTDYLNEQYIREALSEFETLEEGMNSVITNDSTQSDGNYWSRSLDYAIKGDYSDEFTVLGMVGNIAVGFTPVGIAADVRDFTYAVTHTHDRKFWGNVALIGLAAVAFIPLFGDIAKNLKYIKYSDEALDVIKQVDNVDDAVKGLAKNGGGVIETVKKLSYTDLTTEVLDTKPYRAPKPTKWLESGKSIFIDEQGNWVYKNLDGIEVKYINGYPDFKGAGLVKQEVDIGAFSSYPTDFSRANEFAPNGPKLPINTWHHLEDGKTLQEVDSIIHDEFRHIGGMAGSR